eukprot:1139726-Pelagomonas_calceolata.AAC.4
MHSDLSQHVMRNVSRLKLRAHTLKVETVAWDTQNALLCDRCPCDEIQDKAHALLACSDANVCVLRRNYAYLFNCFSGDSSMEQPFYNKPVSRMTSHRPISRTAWLKVPPCNSKSVRCHTEPCVQLAPLRLVSCKVGHRPCTALALPSIMHPDILSSHLGQTLHPQTTLSPCLISSYPEANIEPPR